jgi:hypothetical protein
MAKIPLFGKADGCMELPQKNWRQTFIKEQDSKGGQSRQSFRMTIGLKNLNVISNATLLGEYIMLSLALSSVSLSKLKDEIHWRWTANGKFSVASAYD